MIKLETKVQYFKNYLLRDNNDYIKEIKDYIYEYFFEMIGTHNDLNNFTFLASDTTYKDIELRIDFLISKIIMHEHHAGIETIIEEYSFT